MAKSTLHTVLQCLQEIDEDFSEARIDEGTIFADLPGIDSMSIIDFQLRLSEEIGSKAEDVAIDTKMTIGEFVALLDAV